MRTVLATEDIKNIIANMFAEQNEKMVIIDENNNQTEKDINDYLNIEFYAWKNRIIINNLENIANGEQPMQVFESWVNSLNLSLNKSYALVEIEDEEVLASKDIDNATITGKITFIIQTGKVSNLDYFTTKIKNAYLGVPQDIQNSYGDTIKAFIHIGALLPQEEPENIQFGECVSVILNFSISYLNDAFSYNDTKVELSLTGQTNEFYEVPYTRGTFQKLFQTQAVPTFSRPDLTGFIATNISSLKSITFFDFNNGLTKTINSLFWQLGAIQKDGVDLEVSDVNIPIWVKITSDGHTYLYKNIIDSMSKTIVNGDFNTSTISMKGWGKIENAI